jgi:hypothetical protein
MNLNWNREALDNGDGPATVVAYDDEGNELFWCRELFWPREGGEDTEGWKAFITYSPSKREAFQRVGLVFPDRESAEKICEHFHELAEINHGY